jgi:hypothetical protein
LLTHELQGVLGTTGLARGAATKIDISKIQGAGDRWELMFAFA